MKYVLCEMNYFRNVLEMNEATKKLNSTAINHKLMGAPFTVQSTPGAGCSKGG